MATTPKNGPTQHSAQHSAEADERLNQNAERDREDGYRDEEIEAETRASRRREQDMQMTTPERRKDIQEKWKSSVLPDLPPREGWHRCWVSTTHNVDTPERRLQYGYEFVKKEDLVAQGWKGSVASVKDGDFAGCVMKREMIAMEIPNEGFRAYMREFHFDQPMEATRGIFDRFDQMDAEARESGGRVTVERDMVEDMRARMQRPPPRQFET